MLPSQQVGQPSQGGGTALTNLPTEVFQRIAGNLGVTDLRNLRRVSKEAEEKTTPVLFREVALTPTLNSVSRIEEIAKHGALKSHVRRINVCSVGISTQSTTGAALDLINIPDMSQVDRESFQAYLEESSSQFGFSRLMLRSAGTGSDTQRLRNAFALMPNLTEFSLSDFGDEGMIRNRNADILVTTGYLNETTTINRYGYIADSEEPTPIMAEDLAHWIAEQRPRTVEIKDATPLGFNSVELGDAAFEHLQNTRTFKLQYTINGTWGWDVIVGGRTDAELERRMLGLPDGALDGVSKALKCLRELEFGFDEPVPLGPTAPGHPEWRQCVMSRRMILAQGWNEPELHVERVLTCSMLSGTYEHLHTVKLNTVVTTETDLLDFVTRHVYLRSLTIHSIRIEDAECVYDTMKKLAEALRTSCYYLEHVEFRGDWIDEHGCSICPEPNPYGEPAPDMTGPTDPVMAELPFVNCRSLWLYDSVVNYICRRPDPECLPWQEFNPDEWYSRECVSMSWLKCTKEDLVDLIPEDSDDEDDEDF